MKQWNDLLLQLEVELGKEVVTQWLRPLKIVKFDAGNLYLDAIDTFQIHWFYEYLSPFLPIRLKAPSGKPIKVHLSVQGKSFDTKKKHWIETEKNVFISDSLESHATFEEFIYKNEENLPYQLLSELVEGKLLLGQYNPIYIYGPKGSGKSHLLMATARKLAEQGKRSCYVHADTFTGHVIKAFRSSALQEFRKFYRDIEVLIVDDVHLFSRKGATQEEFFHTFNRLHTAGLQLILASNNPPRLLEEIEERLISRFEWGVTLAMSPSPYKDIILEKRATALAFPLSSSLKAFLLKSFNNLYSLIQALEALALRLPHHQTPDLEIAMFYLRDLVQKEADTHLTPEKVLKHVARHFGIKTEDILGKAQHKECTLPRQIAMYLCRERLNLPFQAIGRLFSRDHSTVITSVKRVKKGIEKKEEEFLLPLLDIERLFF